MYSVLFYCQKDPISKLITNNNFNLNSSITIGNFACDKNLIFEEIPAILNILRKNWFQLQVSVLYGSNVKYDLVNARKELNKCLQLLVEILQCFNGEIGVEKYKISIVDEIDKFTSLIMELNELDNEVFLKFSGCNENCPEYQYFHSYLEIQYYLLLITYFSGGNLEESTEKCMKNFTFLNRKSYTLNKSFYCNCTKNFCVILHYFTHNFWETFNKVVDNEENDFILWLLKEVSVILKENLTENYKLLELTLKKILESTNITNLTEYLKLTYPLACNLWLENGKIEIYLSLWDYYSKRLNVAVKPPNFTTQHYLNLIENIWNNPLKCEDFELFLGMLTTHLKRHKIHWGKIKGRIYSQLGPNKIKDLNDTGNVRVLTLYLALLAINFEEGTRRILGFFGNLTQTKQQTEMVWTVYAAFIIQHVAQNRPIDKIAVPMLQMLEEAAKEHKNSHLIRKFMQDFNLIVKSSENLQLNQSDLLNSWLNKHLQTCYQSDLVNALNILSNTLEKINEMGVWSHWEEAFKAYIYPSLKQIASTSLDIVGVLAAKIALQSPNLLNEAFVFFNSDLISTKISAAFLCAILENYPNSFVITTQQETIILQTWLKVCLLSKQNEKKLTENVAKLDSIPENLTSKLVGKDDAVLALIDFLAETQSNKLCDICFGNIDRWVSHCLTQPENEAIILRIYTSIAIAFMKIGHLLYHRYKSNCIFTRLVSIMLLSTEVMMGKQVNPLVLNCVRKTWHLYFRAFVNLSNHGDFFIDRTLRDFIIKYVNYFSIVESPLLCCLNSESCACVILDKLSNAYFKQPTKESDANIFKSLRILNEFIPNASVSLLRIVIDKTLLGLCETVMFHSQKNTALAVIKTITSLPVYDEIKGDFRKILIGLTEKHLSFNYSNYFQLMGILVKFIPADLRVLVGDIREQVCNVEKMRGVGFDKNLRLHLERFDALL